MAKFRKKPVVIEAMQFKGHSIEHVDEMVLFDDWMVANQGNRKCRYVGNELIIPTLEDGADESAKHVASVGDWIIKGVKGELYACKPDIFELTYEAVE